MSTLLWFAPPEPALANPRGGGGRTARESRARDKKDAPGTTRPTARPPSARQRSLGERLFGTRETAQVRYAGAEKGLVTAVAKQLQRKYGLKYQLKTFERLDTNDSNPFMGQENFFVLTFENPFSRTTAGTGVERAVAPRGKRRILVEVKNRQALEKVAAAADDDALDSAFLEASRKDAFEIHREEAATPLARAMDRVGGPRGMARAGRELIRSAKTGAGLGLLSASTVAGAADSEIVAGGALVLLAGKALRDVRGANQRRVAALRLFNSALQENYRVVKAAGGALKLRRLKGGVTKLDSAGKAKLPETIGDVGTVYKIYEKYVTALNTAPREDVKGRNETGGTRQEQVDAVDELDFMLAFKDVGFEWQESARSP